MQPGVRDGLAAVVGAHLALIVVGSVVISAGGWVSPLPIHAQFLAVVPFWIAAVASTWYVASRTPQPAATLRLAVRPVDVPLGVAVGLGIQWVVIPALYWPILTVLDLDTSDLERAARELADTAQGAGGVTLFVVMTCIGAPLVEEFMYRGLLLRSAESLGPVAAVTLSSVVFGLFHLQPLQFVGLVAFGVGAAALTLRTGRLAAAIVAHIAFNASTVIPLLLSR